MDKLSLQVLKYISKSNGEAEQESIVEQFGENSLRSLTYLEKENFIKSADCPLVAVSLSQTAYLPSPVMGLHFWKNGPESFTTYGLPDSSLSGVQ